MLLKNATVGFMFDQVWLLSPCRHGRWCHVLSAVLRDVEKGVLRPRVARAYALVEAKVAFKNLSRSQGRDGVMLLLPQETLRA